MEFDRLTRRIKFKIGDADYSGRLTLQSLEEVETALPPGETLVSLFVLKRPPTIPVMKRAFVVGLERNEKRVGPQAALEAYEKFIEENGVAALFNLFYALVAASNLLGTKASNDTLAKVGLLPKDDEDEEEEPEGEEAKNA